MDHHPPLALALRADEVQTKHGSSFAAFNAKASAARMTVLSRMSRIVVTKATPEDVEAIQRVAGLSWRATYAGIFPPEFIEDFLQRAYNQEALRQAISEEGSLFLTACDVRGVIGFAQTGFLRNGIAELFRLYVQPGSQRTGAGTRLLAETEAWLAEQDVPGYGAFVHSRNEIGKAFYAKAGFVRRPERDHDGEWYLWKELKEL
jgi:ribosomal protein S18 acetylase RimI-like enzyme